MVSFLTALHFELGRPSVHLVPCLSPLHRICLRLTHARTRITISVSCCTRCERVSTLARRKLNSLPAPPMTSLEAIVAHQAMEVSPYHHTTASKNKNLYGDWDLASRYFTAPWPCHSSYTSLNSLEVGFTLFEEDYQRI